LAWAVALAFVQLTTKRMIMTEPYTIDEALDVVDGWLGRANVLVVHPTDRHAIVLRELLRPSERAATSRATRTLPPSPSSMVPSCAPAMRISRASPDYAGATR